jgi:hypothetical protein
MVRERAALPATADGLDRHHFQGAQIRIAGVIEQHRDILAELLRQIEAGPHMISRIGIGEFDPGYAADDIGAERHSLAH